MNIDRDMEELLGPAPDAQPEEAPRAHLRPVEQGEQKTPLQVEFERCVQWLVPALEGGRRTMADVARAIGEGKAQLWPGKACAMVTEVHTFPTGKALQVWLAGGDMAELMAMQAGVEAWGRLVGCSEVIIEGRKGWERTLKPAGFELFSVCLRKAI